MTTGREGRSSKERGSGTVLTATLALALAGVTLLAAWVVGWTTSIHRAGRAADLAALAGATAVAHGGDGCAAARASAERNGAEVRSCTLRGRAPSFVLVVRTRTDLRPHIRVPGGPRHALGEAAAGPGQP